MVLFLESRADQGKWGFGPSRGRLGGGERLDPAQVRVTLQRRRVGRLQVAVDVAHHARRLLVALRVDVPEHQQRPAPGELQREEAAQAAAGSRDEAHLARHALLLGPHQPARRGQHERPEHFESDHEELYHDVHRDARNPARVQRPHPPRAGQSGSRPPGRFSEPPRPEGCAPRPPSRCPPGWSARRRSLLARGHSRPGSARWPRGCARRGSRRARRLLPAAARPSRSARPAGRSVPLQRR